MTTLPSPRLKLLDLGPGRKADVEIARILGYAVTIAAFFENYDRYMWRSESTPAIPLPDYSTSVDAAMTLLDPSWSVADITCFFEDALEAINIDQANPHKDLALYLSIEIIRAIQK